MVKNLTLAFIWLFFAILCQGKYTTEGSRNVDLGKKHDYDILPRTGLSQFNGPQTGCVKWKFETKKPVSTTVALLAKDNDKSKGKGPDKFESRFYIGCEDGKLYTLNNDGSVLSTFDANSPITSGPVIGHSGFVYFGTEDGILYALNKNGKALWTHQTHGTISSPVTLSENGKIYVCSQDGIIYALNLHGRELWQFGTDGFGNAGGSIFASAAVSSDNKSVYVAGLYDPNLYALNANNGNVKWTCNFASNGWPFASPLLAHDGTIYQTLLNDSNLYAIDPNTGSILWSTDLADPCSGWIDLDYDDKYRQTGGWSDPVLGPDGTIYVSFDDPYLRAVNPDGTIKWTIPLGFTGELKLMPPEEHCQHTPCWSWESIRNVIDNMTAGFTLTVGSDGFIYAAGDDGSIYVTDANGWLVSRFDSNDWLSYPIIVSENTIIVSDVKDNTMILSDVNNTVWAISLDNCQGSDFPLHWIEDLNADGTVNFIDFALLAADWLGTVETVCDNVNPCSFPLMPCNCSEPNEYFTGDIDRDRFVNTDDLISIADRWLGVKMISRPARTMPPVVNIITATELIIQAEAWDPDGSVVKVDFFTNQGWIGSDDDGTDGWEITWDGFTPGQTSCATAKATDNSSVFTISIPIQITRICPR